MAAARRGDGGGEGGGDGGGDGGGGEEAATVVVATAGVDSEAAMVVAGSGVARAVAGWEEAMVGA